MKNIYLVITASLLTLIAKAQTSDEIGKISLAVVMPTYMENLDDSQLAKLDNKISQIVTTAGLSDSGYGNNFVIYPKFTLLETSVVEGGMQNITVVSAELNLFVKQVDNNILFATMVKNIRGSGSSKSLAINNAISKINASDVDYKSFIEKSTTKIIQYYESKCADILKKSDGLVKTQQYEQALGLLMSVPDVVSCYSQVQVKAIDAYKGFQKQHCVKQMQLARNAIATNDYAGTLTLLSKIDPDSPCFEDVQSLVKTIETKVNAEQKRQYDFELKQYNDAVSLERQRINAIKDIAVSYYKSQTATVNYTLIVK